MQQIVENLTHKSGNYHEKGTLRNGTTPYHGQVKLPPPGGLIYKLKRCGESGQLLFLIQSFLKDRKQRTVLNGQSSNWGDISAGVPQGSILGPLFFLVYINDLAVGLKCNVKLFADDTSLFTVAEDSNRPFHGKKSMLGKWGRFGDFDTTQLRISPGCAILIFETNISP